MHAKQTEILYILTLTAQFYKLKATLKNTDFDELGHILNKVFSYSE